MVIPAPNSLLNIFGVVIWGDLGPLTMYRSKRGKLVSFKKTWPKEPPSTEQTAQRQLFTDAAAAWQALTPDQRSQWELATKRASLCMHGYDLFVHYQLVQDLEAIQAVQRQTDTNLVPP